ncbi:MAG: Gfo/Idh/MocA family oxidoreductase [Gaiellales bacterium]
MRVAVVGAGFAGGIHAQAWAGLDGVDVVVADADRERAAAVAQRWGAEPAAAPEAALAPDIDVVDVCLPTWQHAELAIAAARAGKHVLCEKPMAMTVAECERMIEAAQEAGVTLMVGHVLRFWPEYERLRGLVERGELGRLRALACHRLVTRPGPYAPWMLDPAQGLGLGEVAIHDLDVVASLLGPPGSIVAQGVREGAGWSHLQALLRYGDGVTAMVEAGWGTPAAEAFNAGFHAFFEHGVVEYDSRRRPTLRIVRDGGVEEGKSPQAETEGGPWAFDATPYVLEVEEFARCLADRRAPERGRPVDARRAVELTLTAFRAAETGLELPLAGP